HTQFVIDGSRAINPKLRLGGNVWIRRLDDRQDVGPFDTSFEEFRAHAQILPWDKTDVLVGYHFRHSDDRGDPTRPTEFDDLTGTGETQIQDVSVEIGRSFLDGRLHLQAGGFYRLLDFRGQFTVINNARNKGVLANASFNVDSRT